MAKEKREWHQNFIDYMEMIVAHPNYKGLPIQRKIDGSLSWIATAQSVIGKGRIAWCENKARELGIKVQPGVYADVMLAIHPTKKKVCQTCGKEMSLYYLYPNANFLNSLNKEFSTDFTDCDNINDIWDILLDNGVSKLKIARFLINKGCLQCCDETSSKEEIIKALEYNCRKGNKKCLGPGAMSNFPDRYDGFHTYNRCCRSSQDKGRSKENLKSYTKDRRAYEYWSDGNIHAANQYMGSSRFDGISADHIGPISLGFVHDPRYLQPMRGGDNSSKRDRLLVEDVVKILETEKRTGIYPMSWYSSKIWEYIRLNYKDHINLVSSTYRLALKQNMSNFMYILWSILENAEHGREFLVDAFLKPNFRYFEYSYTFSDDGDILTQEPRHFTERNASEMDRYARVAVDAVYDYHEKENRQIAAKLTNNEEYTLSKICKEIESGNPVQNVKNEVIELMNIIQIRLINNL